MRQHKQNNYLLPISIASIGTVCAVITCLTGHWLIWLYAGAAVLICLGVAKALNKK